jgi:hypothetical protein
MRTENLVLLPLTVYGTPSGNYDGSSDTAFDGNQQKGVGYYRSRRSTQSVRFQLSEFVGIIIIQGTLDADPQADSQWFDVYEYGDGSSQETGDFSQALIGNFTWLRARVTAFTGGTITAVTLTY